jgi:hypothetical protein
LHSLTAVWADVVTGNAAAAAAALNLHGTINVAAATAADAAATSGKEEAAAAVREATAGLLAGLAEFKASVGEGQKAAVEQVRLEVATQQSVLLRRLDDVDARGASYESAVVGVLADLRGGMAAVQAAVGEGPGKVLDGLSSLAASVARGFAEVKVAVAAEGAATRAELASGLGDLQGTLFDAMAKMNDAADKSGKDVKKLLRTEFDIIKSALDAMADEVSGGEEALAEVKQAVEAMKAGVLISATAAKDDRAAVGAVLAEATAALGLLAGEVGALRGEVAALGSGWEALVASVEAGNREALAAVGALQATLDALEPSGGSKAELKAFFLAQEGTIKAAVEEAAVAAAAAAGAAAGGGAAAQVVAELATLFDGVRAGQDRAEANLAAALDDLKGRADAALEAQTAFFGCQLGHLEAILGKCESCPVLVAFSPKVPNAGLLAKVRCGWRCATTLNSEHFKCAVLCECCLRKSGGPNGHGYTVLCPSKVLKVLAPMVALALKVVLIAAGVALGGGAGEGAKAGSSLAAMLQVHDSMSTILDLETMSDITEAANALVPEPAPEALSGAAGSSAVGSSAVGGGPKKTAKAAGGGGGGGGVRPDVAQRLQALAVVSRVEMAKLLRIYDPDLEQLDVTYESGAPGTPHSSFKWVCRKCKAGFQKAGADFKPTTGN